MKKIFIGNIPFQSTEEDLYPWFAQFGFSPLSVAIVRHRLTGDSRGFGFADFGSASEAQQAVDALNGSEYEGRSLMLSVAKTDGPAIQAPRESGSAAR
jgi:RNA recognition motif-containing protein